MSRTKKPSPLLEADLYAPVKTYLEAQGYAVQAEVVHCDIVAQKDGELLVVELKTSINLTLLIQATARQAITNSVYVAIPASANRRSRQWRGTTAILRRLQLGLLLVNFGPLGASVKKDFDPVLAPAPAKAKNKKQQAAVVRELDGRSASYNIGGMHQQKLITAYRENAIHIACCLQHAGPLSTRQLRDFHTGDRTLRILSDNHYGWFERISRGVYGLTALGASELSNYPDICQRALALIRQQP